MITINKTQNDLASISYFINIFLAKKVRKIVEVKRFEFIALWGTKRENPMLIHTTISQLLTQKKMALMSTLSV